MQADTCVSSVMSSADATGAQIYERQATDIAQNQRNTHPATYDVAGGLLQQQPDMDLNAAQPHLLKYSQQQALQAKQQTTDARPVQLNECAAKDVTSGLKHSKGGRGPPLGPTGRGRGRGRQRVAIG